MTNDALPADELQLKRMRRSRWLVALLQGCSAALFSVILLGVPRMATLAPIATAFATIALIAFALWPMTMKGRGFSYARVTVFGALVGLIGAYLWLATIDAWLRRASSEQSALWSFLQALFDPFSLLKLFEKSDGLAWGIVTFGLYMLPVSIVIAWAVAILGRNRS